LQVDSIVPLPAATGGGFGFGKFRRDEQRGPKFVAAPHGSFLVGRTYGVSFIKPTASSDNSGFPGSTPASGVAGRALATSRLRATSPRLLGTNFSTRVFREGAKNGARGGRAPPDHFNRSRFFIQNVIFCSHFS
jgi:hypothetical protein